MQRNPIRVMLPDVALKIAAGEVVERPASAVRELIDNAVDAGATKIQVETREAGLSMIRVVDDGCGIPKDELRLALTSHATSKITAIDDLQSLRTLGFRGEALPSVAAVARVEIQSRTADDPVGSRIRVDFGEHVDTSPCSTPQGTRVTVSDLFGNVPARRAFVRSYRSENKAIENVVAQYALAHPAVRCTLTVDGNIALASPGTGVLRDAVAAIYGAAVAARMHEVEFEESGVVVTGLLGEPGLTRTNRSAIHIFVNGRPVQNRSLPFALEEAYTGRIMVGRHPVAVIHLTLDPADIDPNIHPSKSEVRFARDRVVHGVLYRAVSGALLDIRFAEADSAADRAPTTFETAPLPIAADDRTDEAVPGSLILELPTLRVFGQTKGAFIIAEGPQGLYMIDQHAAHERILFDRLDDEWGRGGIGSQPLLQPATVDLDPAQLLALEENGSLLRSAGFIVEPFGSDACLIRAVPALGGRFDPVDMVVEVLTELQTLPEPGAARERALAATACKAAVKAGQSLDLQEMRELVRDLERTARPATCPHGRPTMIHLSHMQLEREFGRR